MHAPHSPVAGGSVPVILLHPFQPLPFPSHAHFNHASPYSSPAALHLDTRNIITRRAAQENKWNTGSSSTLHGNALSQDEGNFFSRTALQPSLIVPASRSTVGCGARVGSCSDLEGFASSSSRIYRTSSFRAAQNVRARICITSSPAGARRAASGPDGLDSAVELEREDGHRVGELPWDRGGHREGAVSEGRIRRPQLPRPLPRGSRPRPPIHPPQPLHRHLRRPLHADRRRAPGLPGAGRPLRLDHRHPGQQRRAHRAQALRPAVPRRLRHHVRPQHPRLLPADPGRAAPPAQEERRRDGRRRQDREPVQRERPHAGREPEPVRRDEGRDRELLEGAGGGVAGEVRLHRQLRLARHRRDAGHARFHDARGVAVHQAADRADDTGRGTRRRGRGGGVGGGVFV